MRKLLLSVAALSLVAAPAMAQDMFSGTNFYGNLGYQSLGSDDTDANLGGVTARLGARFMPNFGVEAEGTIGMGEEDVLGAEVSLKHDAAIYAVGFLPLTENVDVIGRVGFGTNEIEADFGAPIGSISESEESWNYGVGVQWFPGAGANGVRADFTRRELNHDNGSADAWSVSYVRKF
ncbi:MAG TPA: porin family protein [Caulobacteraceae bacterium]|jgi:opacity protein-like surface antigen